VSAICTGCGQTSDFCLSTCPLRTQPTAAPGLEPVASWVETLRRWLDRLSESLFGLPYRPGEVDPRPLLAAKRAPAAVAEQPRPAEPEAAEPIAEPAGPGARKHAAGSRSNLRPVRELLDAARRDGEHRDAEVRAAGGPTELIPLIDPPLLPDTDVDLVWPVAGPGDVEEPTEPIPLVELQLLSHVGLEQLAADTRARNRRAGPGWIVEFVGLRPGPGWPGLIRMHPAGGGLA
jgi:hypothetical protein